MCGGANGSGFVGSRINPQRELAAKVQTKQCLLSRAHGYHYRHFMEGLKRSNS